MQESARQERTTIDASDLNDLDKHSVFDFLVQMDTKSQ
jgi:hypothetical protein